MAPISRWLIFKTVHVFLHKVSTLWVGLLYLASAQSVYNEGEGSDDPEMWSRPMSTGPMSEALPTKPPLLVMTHSMPELRVPLYIT